MNAYAEQGRDAVRITRPNTLAEDLKDAPDDGARSAKRKRQKLTRTNAQRSRSDER